MRIDLFEFVEGLIRGFVYFLYNLVETVVTVIRRPIRGPIRLYRRHRDPDQRQIGGLTSLFLGFFVLYWIYLSALSSDQWEDVGGRFAAVSYRLPELGVESLWPIVLASLISTMVFDGVLRVFLRWELRDRPGWRRLLLASAEYALLWVLIALITGALVVTSLQTVPPDVATYVRELWTNVRDLFVLLATLPPAIVLYRGLRPNIKSAWAGGKILVWMFGLFSLVLLSVSVGFDLGLKATEARRERLARDNSKAMIVYALMCQDLPDGRILVDGFVKLEGGDPMAIDGTNFNLSLSDEVDEYGLASSSVLLTWADPAASRFVVLTEDKPLVVQLKSFDQAKLQDGYCKLNYLGARSEEWEIQMRSE